MPIVQGNVLEYEGEVYARPVGCGIILGGRDELDAAPDFLEEIYGLIGGDDRFVRLRIRVERLL